MATKKLPLAVGDRAPAFDLETDTGERASLAQLAGRPVILYFYPKDDTPGCTKEACGFNEVLPRLTKSRAAVVGVSKDSVAAHARFRKKYSLGFALGSDADGKVCEAYGTWVEKQNYGRTYMGIERSTFLLDGAGVVRGVWRKVKVAGHVEEVLAALAAL